MPRIVDLGATTYLWIPGDSAVANVAAPTVTELTATGAINISPYVVSTTTAGPTASDTISERAITDTANVVTPTVGNYEGSLVLFRDYADGVPSENDLMAEFKAGSVGYLVRRNGKTHSDPVAADDEIDFIGKFRADNPQTSGGTGDGYLKMTVPLLAQGVFAVGVKVVAGP